MKLEDLDAQLAPILEQLQKVKGTDPDQYHRGLMFLALNYAQNGFPEDAHYMVVQIPRTYFQTAFLVQCETAEFFQVALKLHALLAEAGFEPMNYTTLMKPAEA